VFQVLSYLTPTISVKSINYIGNCIKCIIYIGKYFWKVYYVYILYWQVYLSNILSTYIAKCIYQMYDLYWQVYLPGTAIIIIVVAWEYVYDRSFVHQNNLFYSRIKKSYDIFSFNNVICKYCCRI